MVLSSVVQPSSPCALPKSSETVLPEEASAAVIVWQSPPVVLNHPSCATSHTWWLTPGEAVNDSAPPPAVVPAALPSRVKSQPSRPGSPTCCVPLRLESWNLLTLIVMSFAFPKVTDAVAPDAVTDLQPVPPGSVLFHPLGRGVDSQTV